MKKFILLLTALTFFAFKTGEIRSNYNIPRSAYSVTAGDIDLDGDQDIVVGHKTAWENSNPTISILENNDSGYFNIIDTSKAFCGYQENILLFNMNDDTLPDIVSFYSDFSSGEAERYIRIYYNEEGAFNNFNDYTLDTNAIFSYINYGDINGDSLNDIVVVSNNDQFWGILYNDGTGGFSAPEYHEIEGSYPTDIACGDLDGNGREDIVVCGSKVEIHYSFEEGFESQLLTEHETRARITDFDLDGDNDIIALTDLYIVGKAAFSIFENTGDNAFTEHEEYNIEPSGNKFITTDMNNNDLPDIAFLSHFPHFPDSIDTENDTIGGIYLIYNEGNNTLAGQPQFIPLENYREGWRDIHCEDMDGNGYNDIVIVRTLYAPLPANLTVLFNDGDGNFVPEPLNTPEYPGNLNWNNTLTCYPNPFKQETTFEINLKKPAQAELAVYNLKGRFIRCLTNKFQKGGSIIKIKWDGLDESGNRCKPGPYIAYLKVNGKIRRTVKILKTK
ncbi:MAG: FG-GAP-like repeat-containing protein [Bacteroidales bacterium]|nr:FG-GAP-like repeat-containing protein [Bacteroidales bacterium]MCF8337051.1 FG-GAP-like repeat-containing protein [Bacteroidales bacterium]